MEQAARRHSIFEVIVLAALVLAANWHAFTISFAGLLAVFHTGFLISLYMLLRLAAKRLNIWVGKLIFAVTVLLLTADILVQYKTGLHLNPFVISVMVQPNVAAELGISTSAVGIAIISAIAACIYGARRLSAPSVIMRGRNLLALTLALGMVAQGLYGILFYRGMSEIEDARRSLAFFSAPHPYYRNKILSIFGAPKNNNPFSAVRTQNIEIPGPTPLKTFIKPRRNILMIVADSVRSKDIAAQPSLTPNLFAWAQKGAMSLNHYSTSNCTHFSFYSMFTGALPTGFGAARRTPHAAGLMPALAENGYSLSTSEAKSLNWYDTASIIFPPQTARYVSAAEGAITRDIDVTKQTMETLSKHQLTDDPFFHLSYYFGPHYPYDPALDQTGESNLDRYKSTLQGFDAELGKLMRWLEAKGILDDTIVIVTSDHGEEFQTTGRTGHATRLSDEQVKVPFLLIDQNANATGALSRLKSHLDIAPYLLGQLGGSAAAQAGPIILANCDYDYPSGFALIMQNGARSDFAYRDGYLTPTKGPDGTKQSTIDMKLAAAQLITIINKPVAAAGKR